MQITKNNMPYNVCIIHKVYMYSKWGISEQVLWSLKFWVQFGTELVLQNCPIRTKYSLIQCSDWLIGVVVQACAQMFNGLGLWCSMSLSTIFQLYLGCKCFM